jgi:hypothetical protein
MANIDRRGTYLGKILESTVGQTKANGYPQWVARLLATKKYITEPAELTHFGLAEPGYVDWNYDQSIVAFLVLFSDKGAMLNYDQIQAATGWDGQDFATLPDQVGKDILFRVEEDTYNDRTQLKVNWVDHVDAPPERSLKSLDKDALKGLSSQWLTGMKKTPPKVATAATSAPKSALPPVLAKPAPAAMPSVAGTVSAPATVPVVVSAPTGSIAPTLSFAPVVLTPPTQEEKPKRTRKAPPAAVVDQVAPASALPSSITKNDAWDYLFSDAIRPSLKGDDSAVETAWMAACKEVGPSKQEPAFTGEDWAAVRDLVAKKLA